MPALTIIVQWLSVFALLHGVQSGPSDLERAGRIVRDSKVLSANDLSPDEYDLLMTGGSQLRRARAADADAWNVPTAAGLIGGASKGLGVDELWEEYKSCSNEYETEEESKAINHMAEVIVNLASDVASAGVPLGDGSRALAVVNSTFDIARKTAVYAIARCIPETRLVKGLIQESIRMLTDSLANPNEMKKNEEYLMKILDVDHGNLDELRKKMDSALKQLTVAEGQIAVLDGRIVQRAGRMSRSFEEMENFYRHNISEESIGDKLPGYRKALRRAHGLVLNLTSFNGTDQLVFRQKHKEIVQACKESDPRGVLHTLGFNVRGAYGTHLLPAFYDTFRTDVVQFSMFFCQILVDMLLATTVWSECDGAKGISDDTTMDNLAYVLETIPQVLVAFRQPLQSYQKEHLTMWDERPIPTPLNYIPLIVGQFKRAVSPSRVDPVEAAAERKTKLFLFRSFLAYTPERPNAKVQPTQGHIDERDTVAGADYSKNWGFIVNRYDTNKSKRDLAVVYADKSVGYALPFNASEDNIVDDKPHKLAKTCYRWLAEDIANFWANEYSWSNSSKWQFTEDTLYSRIPEIFAEIELRKPKLLKGFMDPGFKCNFLPLAVHYGISFSKAPWLPTKNATYFYTEPGESFFKTTSNGRAPFFFHAIVYY